MQLSQFVFSTFQAGMFDAEKSSAIFIFQHVNSNLHYAARYWDASRYNGSENYPLALTNQLLRDPSEVHVFVLPLKTKNRVTAEKVMNKVVDALTDEGLYRKCKRVVNNVLNVIHQEQFKVYKLVHNETGAEYYTHELEHVPGSNILNRSVIRFNGMALEQAAKEDALDLFSKQFFPTNTTGWTLHELMTVSSLSQAHQTIEELSLNALRMGVLVLNRIRTHSPLWYYNNLYRGKNLLIAEYVHAGINKRLQLPRAA